MAGVCIGSRLEMEAAYESVESAASSAEAAVERLAADLPAMDRARLMKMLAQAEPPLIGAQVGYVNDGDERELKGAVIAVLRQNNAVKGGRLGLASTPFVMALHKLELQGSLTAIQALVMVCMQRQDPDAIAALFGPGGESLNSVLVQRIRQQELHWRRGCSRSRVALRNLEDLQKRTTAFSSYDVYCLAFLALMEHRDVLAAAEPFDLIALSAALMKHRRTTRLPRVRGVLAAEAAFRDTLGPSPTLHRRVKTSEERVQLSLHQIECLATTSVESMIAGSALGRADSAHLHKMLFERDPRLYETVLSFAISSSKSSFSDPFSLCGSMSHLPIVPTALASALATLARSWRDESEHLALLELIDGMALPIAVSDALEHEVYLEGIALLSAYDVYVESMYAVSAWFELLDTFEHVLRRRYGVFLGERHEDALQSLVDAFVRSSPLLPPADADWIQGMVNKGNAVLSAAFALFLEDGDMKEFQDTADRLARQWRSQPSVQQGLRKLDKLTAAGYLAKTERELLEFQLVRRVLHMRLFSDPASAAEASLLALEEEQADTLKSTLELVASKGAIPDADQAYLKLHLHEKGTVVTAALLLYRQGGDEDDLFDTIAAVGRSWRRRTCFQAQYMPMRELQRHHTIDAEGIRTLELAIVQGDYEDLASRPLQRLKTIWADEDEVITSVLETALLSDVSLSSTVSPSGRRSLLHLFDKGDAVLMAAAATFIDNGSIAEFTDTLARLASRWRNRATSDVSATLSTLDRLQLSLNGPASGSGKMPVVEALSGCWARASEAHCALEEAVYEHDPTLMTASELYRQGVISTAEFTDTLAHVLSKRKGINDLTCVSRARHTIDALGACGRLMSAQHAFLLDLLNEERIGDPASCSKAEYMHYQVLLQSAMALYDENGDSAELFDTLQRLSHRWKDFVDSRILDSLDSFESTVDTADVAALLAYRGVFVTNESVDFALKDRLETARDGVRNHAERLRRSCVLSESDFCTLMHMVDDSEPDLKKDAAVQAAWLRFEKFGQPIDRVLIEAAIRWQERPRTQSLGTLVDLFANYKILEGWEASQMRAMLERGHGLGLAMVSSDPLALIAAIRTMVGRTVNLQLQEASEAAKVLQSILEDEGVISAPASFAIQALISAKDPVLLAAAEEFREGGDAEDLCDTVERILRRMCKGDTSGRSRSNQSFALQQHDVRSNDTGGGDGVCAQQVAATVVKDLIAARNLPLVGARYLQGLVRMEDDAVLDAADRLDFDGLEAASRRWQEQSCWADVRRDLLEVHGRGIVDAEAMRHLQRLVDSADQRLLAAWDNYHATGSSEMAYGEFCDTLQRLQLHQRRLTPGVSIGDDTRPLTSGYDPYTPLSKLRDLLHDVDKTLLTPSDEAFLQEAIDSADVVLDAVWYEFVETGDVMELVDSVWRRATQWRRHKLLSKAVEKLEELRKASASAFSKRQLDLVEMHCYEGDDELIAALRQAEASTDVEHVVHEALARYCGHNGDSLVVGAVVPAHAIAGVCC